jgi:hypothetical protein
MKKPFSLLFVIFIFLCSCNRNPCNDLVNGVYQFPDLPKNHSMTSQEVTKYRDLPSDISRCISTEGLIETCLNYPNLGLILAGSNPQSGYDLLVRENFLGIRELESRPDRGLCLLKKFQTIDPLGYDPDSDTLTIGRYVLYICYFEIIFSQYCNLKPLTKQNKIDLIEKAISVYENQLYDIDNYALFGLECTTTLTGRLMLQDNYVPAVQIYSNDLQTYELIDFYGPSSFDTINRIFNLSKDYLTYLKNN